MFTEKKFRNLPLIRQLFSESKIFIILLACLFSASAVRGQSYSGGSGTSGDPYQIANKTDLKYLSENSGEWTKYFAQTADIALLNSDFQSGGDFYNGGGGFIPIGNSTTSFSGSYDGAGHTIDNLQIYRSSSDYIGLFGYANGAAIKNIGLTNVNISGNGDVGGLVGYGENTSVDKSYSTGSVNGAGLEVGGLAGGNWTNCTVSQSFSTCGVTGDSEVGGLLGFQYSSSVNDCYARGSVTATGASPYYYAGGLVGYNYNSSTIDNCYSSGTVGPTDVSVGGLIGYNYDDNSATDSFWDTDASGQSSSAGGAGKTTTEMTTDALVFNYSTNIYLAAGWDFKGESTNGASEIWNIGNSRNDGYPYFDWQYPSDSGTLPVELISFTVNVIRDKIILKWKTATEINNYGFEIQRSIAEGLTAEWKRIGFTEGAVNSASPNEYSFIDSETLSGVIHYRLKQIDCDGSYEYFPNASGIEVRTAPPEKYSLSQNYPNPFSKNSHAHSFTVIKYLIPSANAQNANGIEKALASQRVVLNVYDILGRKVETLVNEFEPPGNYKIEFNAGKLPSGIYFYRLIVDDKYFAQKKLVILK